MYMLYIGQTDNVPAVHGGKAGIFELRLLRLVRVLRIDHACQPACQLSVCVRRSVDLRCERRASVYVSGLHCGNHSSTYAAFRDQSMKRSFDLSSFFV